MGAQVLWRLKESDRSVFYKSLLVIGPECTLELENAEVSDVKKLLLLKYILRKKTNKLAMIHVRHLSFG